MTIKNCQRFVEEIFRNIKYLFLLPGYLIAGCLPRNRNLWLFTSEPKLYNDNSRLFFEWVNQNHPEIKAVWISKSDDVVRRIRSEKRKAFHNHSFSAHILSARAGKVFTSTGSISRALMNGIDWYDLWHAMPLKQVGDSIAEWKQKTYPAGKAEKFILGVSRKLFPWSDPYGKKTHMTIVNSPSFVPIMKEAFRLSDKDILKTGSPRCDALFSGRPEPFLENLRTKFPECKIILYMPTFRSMGKHGGVFNPFIEKYRFHEAEFERALERNNCVFLYKAHSEDLYSKDKQQREAHSRFLEISDNDYDELYNFVGQVDMLVTDFSSIYFDFLATKKPVILCPFDFEAYIKYSRPLYFDYFENIEGVKARDWHEFIKILDEKSYYPVSEATRIKFAEYLDGNCCQKVYDAVMENDRKK